MRVLLLLAAALVTLASTACGDAPKPCPVCAARAAEAAARAHPEGPHGGSVVVSGDHSAHFEILHDGGAQRVDLYVFDADMKPLAATDAPVLNLVRKGKSTAIDGEGAADHWTFTSWRLGMDPKGRFRVEIGERIYVPTFEHTHAETTGHGHDAPATYLQDEDDEEDDDEDDDDGGKQEDE